MDPSLFDNSQIQSLPVTSAELRRATITDIVPIRGVAQSYLWWPGLDAEIEKLVQGCKSCQEVKNSPPATALLILQANLAEYSKTTTNVSFFHRFSLSNSCILPKIAADDNHIVKSKK